jgi:hypothetical protein
MWEGVGSRIILLDLFKLMQRNGLTLEELYNKWIGTSDRSGLQNELTLQIFGQSFSRGGSKNNYKASSDFDIYRELFEKVFDIFSQLRQKSVAGHKVLDSKKRPRPESNSDSTNSKRRRSTISSASSLPEEKVQPHTASEVMKNLNANLVINLSFILAMSLSFIYV